MDTRAQGGSGGADPHMEPLGKATSSMNAWRGGHRGMLRELAHVLKGHREALDAMDC